MGIRSATTEATATRVPPKPGLSHLEGIDGIRAIAALAVFATHWAALTPLGGDPVLGIWWSQLNIGVSIFFVLSGFLLYRPFVAAALASAPQPRLGPFLVRRAFRIYPAYWVAFAFDMWIGWQFRLETGIGWLTNIILVDDYFQNAEPTRGLPQSWTLVVEVGFYLFLPVFVLFSRRILRRTQKVASPTPNGLRTATLSTETLSTESLSTKSVSSQPLSTNAESASSIEIRLRNQVAALGVIGIGSMLAVQFGRLPAAVEGIDIWHFEIHPFSFFRWLGMFAAGMALALAWNRERSGSSIQWLQAAARHPARCWLGALALFTILNEAVGMDVGDGAAPIENWQWAARHLLHIAIAVLLILPAVTRPTSTSTSLRPRESRIRAFLGHPTMVFLGTASYGIYLWHFGILVFLGREWLTEAINGDVIQVTLLGLVALALTTAFGWLSYRAIEAPAQRLARQLTRAPSLRQPASASTGQ